jgi:hypothetical protein
VVWKIGCALGVSEAVSIGEPRPNMISDDGLSDIWSTSGCSPLAGPRSVANVVFFRRDLSTFVTGIRSWPGIRGGDLGRLSSKLPPVTLGVRMRATLDWSSPLGRGFFKIGGGNDVRGELVDFLSAPRSTVFSRSEERGEGRECESRVYP